MVLFEGGRTLDGGRLGFGSAEVGRSDVACELSGRLPELLDTGLDGSQ
jgi:hypothetical protein